MNRITTVLLATSIMASPFSLNAANSYYEGSYLKTSTSARTMQALRDTEITSNVKNALLTDQRTRGLGIDVATLDGVVTLTGAVNSPYERKRAERIALNTEGVSSIQNQLRISER